MWKKRANILIFISLLFCYCETEIDTLADWKNIPIVYGMLDVGKEVQYIRINKAYLGKADARVMGREADSIQYKHLEVSIEKVDNPDEKIYFMDTLIYKDIGAFSQGKNYIYYSREKIEPNTEYKLNIIIPEYNDVITGRTNVFGQLVFTNIFTYSERRLSFSSNKTETLVWNSTPNAKIYDISIRFYYLEVSSPGDTTELFVDWKQTSKIASKLSGGEKMSLSIKGEDFYKHIKKKSNQTIM